MLRKRFGPFKMSLEIAEQNQDHNFCVDGIATQHIQHIAAQHRATTSHWRSRSASPTVYYIFKSQRPFLKE
eukprot:m.90390 g.90390  ORF g.90390 m.90390 type:complete len:71 (-) comp26393_c0_seq1:1151-1363(-)